MLGTFRWMIPLGVLLLIIVFFVGCAQNERREVTVVEEQHESEVTEEQPGEMIVE